MKNNKLIRLAGYMILALSLAPSAGAEQRPYITLASTTSTENSGLFEHLLPAFSTDHGIDVRVVAVGTGAALELGRRCDVDVLLVHAKAAEEQFVAEGYGSWRRDVMYNDFLIVGPRTDPAGVGRIGSATAALGAIAEHKAAFLSRGDDSGTHKKEQALWRAAGIDPGHESGTWYREAGSGMGATLNTASAMAAYTLADRGTWLSFTNRGPLTELLAGDPALFNQYGLVPVNPLHCPGVKHELVSVFGDWLLSERGQTLIGSYRLNGEPLFHPNP